MHIADVNFLLYKCVVNIFTHLGDAAIVFEQTSYTVVEGSGPVEVCVEISDLPAGGLGCDVTVNFVLLPGTIAGKYVCTSTCRKGALEYSLGLFDVPENCSHSLKQASMCMYIVHVHVHVVY